MFAERTAGSACVNAVDLLLHRSRLLLQAGRAGALRRDEGEVADEHDQEERARDGRDLLAV
jgi:hypothetical protein